MTRRLVVLWIPASSSAGAFRSVERVRVATRRALESRFDLVEPTREELATPRGIAGAVARLRDRVDVVFDLSAAAWTGPAAPEIPVVALALGAMPRGATFLSSRRRYLKSTDSILVNCTADLAILERTIEPGAIHGALVPFGVDTEAFRPSRSAAERRDLRRALGLPTEAFLVAYAGRINVQKNLHGAIRLVAAAAAREPRIHLAIAGAEDQVDLRRFRATNRGYREALEQAARRLGVEDRVTFTGALADDRLAGLLRASDAFLTLSLHHDENFGFAPVEAMASGLPAIVTDWGGYRDTVEDGLTGARIPTFLCTHGVRAAWRRAVAPLLSLASDEPRREALARAARARAVALFSHERFVSRLAACVEEAAGRRGEPAVFGDRGFRFHPLARALHAANALRALTHERVGGKLDIAYGPEDYPSYRFFIRPYATEDVSEIEAKAADRPSLLVDARADAGTLLALDPIWPSEHPLPAGLAEALTRLDGSATIADLAAGGPWPLAQLVDAHTALARAGVIDLGRELTPPQA